jgi:D-aminopeptidase
MPFARDYPLNLGKFPPGPMNAITDVPDVRVGHQTIRRNGLLTGVTAILPHGGNLYRDKVVAAVEIINGYGKSIGLMQVAELGSIETPILLTNTFSVAPCLTVLLRRAILQNPDIGRETSTVNPVVCECNDGWLSDLQAFGVTEVDAESALDEAKSGVIEQGSVGAGTGTVCFGFKGGIGTASRQVKLDSRVHTLGVLAFTNFGAKGKLLLPCGSHLSSSPGPLDSQEEKGSVIIIVAVDFPAESRQLHRLVKRCGAGLARLGSHFGHGSGDIAIGFSTASRIRHDEQHDIVDCRILNESRLEKLFEAVCDATVEAVLNSMLMSPETTGRNGHFAPSLSSFIRT